MPKASLLVAAAAALIPVAPAQAVAPNVITAVSTEQGYAPGDVVVVSGGSLTFVNLDAVPHDITSVDDYDNDGIPNFQAKAGVRGSADSVVPVPNVSTLGPGYHQFICVAHETMRGTIRIVPDDN